jgi:hypothetical protein
MMLEELQRRNYCENTEKDRGAQPNAKVGTKPKRCLRDHPNSYGALTFSRVAFNRELTEAFFYTEHLCGLCGEGKFVYMRKTAGKWAVADTAGRWIS